MVSSALFTLSQVCSKNTLGSAFRVGLKFLTINFLGPALECIFAAILLTPFRESLALAELLPGGLELRSTTSTFPFLLGKLYMFRESRVGVIGGVLVVSVSSASGSVSSLVRLLDGERGAWVATLGFCCVVKRSLIVLAECFRFLSAAHEGEDIWSSATCGGGRGGESLELAVTGGCRG